MVQAGDWRKAQDIRAMVAALEATPRAQEPAFAAWRAQALEAALRLDPVLSDQFKFELPAAFDDPAADAGKGSRT